ncbi:methylated-DNA--[protein]-cysteine S-methyltransferase [Fodinibius halophilus]|uniref:Methylated-DNA--protein-cysteine methyltransferase n=1 Tax=Fodinibius halophilus TaxID=1736908 RepID=A0A6M1T4G5_9BACT|nr:methylated-DNA--[protein]-cysteine S-methyltransferase [Fodinibius halophilus]NGP88125.1 methylated-DNA--[protein]-cysteine S-methyltransferase [Fodinibius halophilus]
MSLVKSHYKSPLGWLELSTSEGFLYQISFLDSRPKPLLEITNTSHKKIKSELDEYFRGEHKQFTLPLKPEGTNFQQRVWNELQQIPFGCVTNYGELAKRLGDVKKVRAVGRANGQNPIPIIIPCHRVIGVNNNLVGYAGGISRKKFLLKHEGALLL